MKTAYDTDFHRWAEEQANLLRHKRFSDIDIENLVEEIDSMARSERRELASRMEVLIKHLLKWNFQPDLRSTSWESTIYEQRVQIQRAINDMPSLRNLLLEDDRWLLACWRHAQRQAVIETGLTGIPPAPIWTVRQLLGAGDAVRDA